MKDYIRQEIFNVTENLVSLCQKNRALHNIRFDILMPDFLWESGFFENLSFDERNIFRSNVLLLIWTNTCNLPLATMSSFRSFLPLCALSCRPNIWNTSNNRRTPVMPLFLWMEKSEGTAKRRREGTDLSRTKIVGEIQIHSNQSLQRKQIKLLVECINEAHIFTTTITPKILSDFFACKLNGVLKSNNNRLLAYLMMQLSCYNYIAYEWQSVIANNKLVTCQDKRQIPHTQRLVERDRQREVHLPEGYEIIDKYIKQLQKG